MMHTYFSSVANTVDENANADDIDEEMVLKNWASFTDCINKINNTDAENAKDLDLVISMYNSLMYSNNPMDTSSLIIHRFDVEIARGKFEEITSILKGELMLSTLIQCGYLDMDSTFKINKISMSSPRGFFYIVSTSNWPNFCTGCFHSIIF